MLPTSDVIHNQMPLAEINIIICKIVSKNLKDDGIGRQTSGGTSDPELDSVATDA